MNIYIFEHNGEKIKEEIKLTHINENSVTEGIIGNIYNVIDFISNIEGTAKVKFVNFTGNKLDLIVKAIINYKTIVSNEEYYSMIIKDKKRIRGK